MVRMGWMGFAGALLALGTTAGAAVAQDGPDPAMRTYERQFNDLRDALAGRERRETAVKEVSPGEPWTSADLPAPRGAARDVPEGGAVGLVGRATPGSSLEPGDRCRMGPGGDVVVLGDGGAFGALVRYAARGQGAIGREDCPTGTIAFVPGPDLFAWPARGEVSAERARIGALAAKAADGVMGPVGSE